MKPFIMGWSRSLWMQEWGCGTGCAKIWKRASQEQNGCVSRGSQRGGQINM